MSRVAVPDAARTVARRVAMPNRIEPMLARLAPPPPDPSGWAFETKWDGVRALVYADRGHIRATSRNHNDITAMFPELRALERLLAGRRAVLDGELVTLDSHGHANFQKIQSRMGLSRPETIATRARAAPATLVVFDVVWLDGRRIGDLAWNDRYDVLQSLPLEAENVQRSCAVIGELDEMFQQTRTLGLEGLIAKRVESPYREGARSGEWIKIKHVRRQEFVIGGYTEGAGSRRGTIGALLIGHYDMTRREASRRGCRQRLEYAGSVGTGFTREWLQRLGDLLAPLSRDESPFDIRSPAQNKPVGKWQAMTARGAPPVAQRITFVEPRLVCEVAYTEFTRDGTLRHPSFKGIRQDKHPRDVVREDTQEDRHGD